MFAAAAQTIAAPCVANHRVSAARQVKSTKAPRAAIVAAAVFRSGGPPAQLVAGGKAGYYRFLGQWVPRVAQIKAFSLFGLHRLDATGRHLLAHGPFSRSQTRRVDALLGALDAVFGAASRLVRLLPWGLASRVFGRA